MCLDKIQFKFKGTFKKLDLTYMMNKYNKKGK